MNNTDLRLFIDINETLIRTGEVPKNYFIRESKDLLTFKKLCSLLSNKYRKVEIVLLTGNSFEYSRRVEEPLGIKNITNITVVIISENGLIARCFEEGDLWHLIVEDDYRTSTENFINILNNRKDISFYTQGNETRVTLKPSRDFFNEPEITELKKISEKLNLEKYCRLYFHKYYVDLDPKFTVCNGKRNEFHGKYYAAKRIMARNNDYLNIAIGDSRSDIPMFMAVHEHDGKSFWVSNSTSSSSFEQAEVVPHEFTKGVNHVLESLL